MFISRKARDQGQHLPRLDFWDVCGLLSHPPSLSGVDVIGKPRLGEVSTDLVARITATKATLRACRLACNLGALAPFFVFMKALLSPKYHIP